MWAEVARPRVIREHPRAGWFAVGAVCFASFMGQLDASIVTLVFPALQREFGAPLAAVQWVSLGYLLTVVGVITAAGRLADAAGRKRVYLVGLVVFTAASAACGLAGGLGWLIGFRVVQALGAAMVQANTVALVVTSLRADAARAALGVQAAAQALGLALGPVLGGLLAGAHGWRAVFWVTVPVGLLALIAGRYLLPRTRTRCPLTGFDWPGLVLLAGAGGTTLLAVSGVSGLALPRWVVLALAVVAVLAGVAFVLRQARTATPLIRLTVLRSLPVSAGLAGALCGYLVLFGPLALLPQLHQVGQAALTALPAGFAVAAVAAGRLPQRWPVRARSVTGALVAAGAAATLVHWPTPLVLAVLGVGLGVFIPANNAAVLAAIPDDLAATGGALVNLGRGLGTAFGVAAVTFALHVSGPGLALGLLAVVALLAASTALAG